MSAYHLHVAYSPFSCGDKTQIRIRIQCVGSVGSDANIFAYRRAGDDMIFSHVCSTVDMVEYPLQVSCAAVTKWARLDYVDLLVRHASIAKEFVDAVKSDVQHLYRHMQAHNILVGENLSVDQNTVVGDALVTTAVTYTWKILETLPLEDTVIIHEDSQDKVRVTSGESSKVVEYRSEEDFTGIDVIRYFVNGVVKDLFIEVTNGD